MQIYYLKQVAFEIVISDTQLKTQVTAVKKALGEIKGAGVNIKLNVTKVEIAALRKKVKDTLDQAAPIPLKLSGTANLVTNANSFAKGIEKAALNMEKFLKLIKESAIESATIRNNLGSSGGGGRGGRGGINGGSRTGFTDSGGASLSAFSGFIRGGQSFTSQIGAYASGIGRLGISASLPVAVIALLTRGLMGALAAVTEFGDKQAELASVLGTTRNGIVSLTEQAKSLGATMSFTASEISGAQIELAKLGFTQSEILSSTEGVARFAIVAGAKIPEAAEAAGAALKSFELEATEMDRVVSVLGVSTARSALDFEKLKVGIGTTFATAKTFGLEIEDVVTLLGELSNRGLSASVAATATRNILLNLADANGKLRKSLSGLGVDEVKGLDGILLALRKLNAAGIDLNSTFELTDKRSINAFNSFLRSSKDLQKMKDSLVDVNDEFKVMEKERLNSLQGAITIFKSELERMNLSLDITEGTLKNVVEAGSDFLALLSDIAGVKPGEAVAKEGLEVTSLIKALIEANDNYALRARLIAQLKVSYPDIIKNIDLEKASVSDLKKLLAETLKLYAKKVDVAVAESEFEKGIKRENELLEKQVKLIKESQTSKVKTGYNGVVEERETAKALKEARESNILNISGSVASTGKANLAQEEYLRDVISQRPTGRGGRLSGDAKVASTVLRQIGYLRSSVAQDVPKFTDSDYAIPDDGQLSKVDEYLEKLRKQRDLYDENSVQADELSKSIKRVEDTIEKRRKPLVDNKDNKDKPYDPKKDAKSGSIDELEEKAAYFTKQIDAVGDEKERYKLQIEAEKFKKSVKEARAKLKAELEITDEEKIKLFNNSIDNEKDLELKANEERFKDARIRDAVDLERVKTAELKKIIVKAYYQKKDFDAGLDKSGEYLRTQQEFDNKLIERKEATEKRLLVVGQVSREMDVKDRLATARIIYKDESDFAKAKESLFLELEVSQLRSLGVLTLAQEEQLNGLLEKIKSIDKELANSSFNKGLTLTANTTFNSAFSSANEDGLSKQEIENLKEVAEEAEYLRATESKQAEIDAETIHEKKVALQREYNELVIANQNREYENKEKKEKEFWDIVKQGADIAGQISSELFNYQKAEQEARADSELETIDGIYEAKLKAAEGNAAETERIEQEYQAAKKAAEKKAAEERRQIALKEAIVNLALSILKAAPNLVLMGVAAVIGGIQIATISRQKFARGGHTGQGYGSPDETGEVPVGIVHAEEYVIPKWQVRKNPSLIRSLESDRLRGYATGGLVAASQQSGFNYEAMVVMADIIASRVGQSVMVGSMKGTEMGSEMGTGKGINKAARETASRDSARRVNTF